MTATPTPATPTPTPEPTIVQLPKWTDAASVISYLTSAVGIIFAFITGLHPGYTEPTIIQTILPSIGALIAAGAQIFNIVSHRGVQKVAIQAAVSAAQVVGGQNIVLK